MLIIIRPLKACVPHTLQMNPFSEISQAASINNEVIETIKYNKY
jgi:hypothetical protein